MEQQIQEEEVAVDLPLYEVDEDLSPLQSVLKYGRSDLPPQRYAYLRGLGAVASQVDKAEAGQLDELVSLASDALSDAMRDDDTECLVLVMEQLPALGHALRAMGYEHLVSSLGDRCLQAVSHHAADDTVVAAGTTAYGALVASMPQASAVAHVTGNVQPLLSSGDESQVCLALAVLGECSVSMALDHTPSAAESPWGRVLQQALSLATASDAASSVQEALLQHAPAMSLLLPEAQRGPQLLLPACTSLAADPIWTVRAAVARAMPAAVVALTWPPRRLKKPQQQATHAAGLVAASLRPVTAAGDTPSAALDGQAERRSCPQDVGTLLQVLCSTLAKDVSQWVRSAAIKAAGPVLVALARAEVAPPPSLLDTYCQCVGGVRAWPADVVQEAAQCLAEVAAATCTPATTPQLLSVCLGLIQSTDRGAAAAVCGQLPQLAALLGGQTAAEALLPSVYSLQPEEVRDHLRQALVPCAADLADCLTPEAATRLLEFLISDQVSAATGSAEQVCGAWRQRLALAQQLARLAASCSSAGAAVQQLVLSCAERLCSDPVFSVRQEAARQLGVMLRGTLTATDQPGTPFRNSVLQNITRMVGCHTPSPQSSPGPGTVAGATSTHVRLFVETCTGFLHAHSVTLSGSSHGALTDLAEGDTELGQAGASLGKLVSKLQRHLPGEVSDAELRDTVDKMLQSLQAICGAS